VAFIAEIDAAATLLSSLDSGNGARAARGGRKVAADHLHFQLLTGDPKSRSGVASAPAALSRWMRGWPRLELDVDLAADQHGERR
jgi:hypothetical protein